MSLLSKQAAALLLGAIASLVVVSAQAAPAKPAGDAPAQKVSMLGGKFTFTLPKGFTATPLPAGEVAQGTAGATGTMYSNATSRTVVIAAENTIVNGTNVKDDDGAFLDTTMADFAAQRIKALPDAKILSEKSLTQKAPAWACVSSTPARPRAAGQPSTPRCWAPPVRTWPWCRSSPGPATRPVMKRW